MAVVKSHQVDALIKNPKKGTCAYLIYGTDEGNISENASQLAKNWSKKFGEDGDILQITEASLADNPDILAIELRSIPMFGGRCVVRLSLSNRIKPDLIKELIAFDLQNLLILEAGNLKPGSAIRKLFEKSNKTAALPCFPDEERDITRLIDEELISKNFTVSPEARNMLIANLGSDRGISRQELMKLALYADGKNEITLADIDANIGDSSQLAYDQLIALIMAGNGAKALSKLDRLLSSGQTSAGLSTLLGRHLTRLYKIRALMENGRQAKNAISSLRPPVHFKQRANIENQANRLSLPVLKKAIHLVQETVARSRSQSALELISVQRMIMILSTMTAPRR